MERIYQTTIQHHLRTYRQMVFLSVPRQVGKTTHNGRLNPALEHFNPQLKAPHVLQGIDNMPFVECDCFALQKPTIVPLITLLSQLL